jgi:hypothetical protein
MLTNFPLLVLGQCFGGDVLDTIKSSSIVDAYIDELDYELDLFTVYLKLARHLMFQIPSSCFHEWLTEAWISFIASNEARYRCFVA